MPAWPSSLSTGVLTSGFNRRPGANVIRSRPSGGEPRQRRRTTGMPHEARISFNWTEAQLATFEAFWTNDLGDGALKFTDFPHPDRIGQNVTARFNAEERYDVTVPDAEPDRRVVTMLVELF